MWECQLAPFKKENKLQFAQIMKNLNLDPLRPLNRLIPRSVVRGGYLEVFRLHSKKSETSKIHFVDFNSMYPSVARNSEFPLGEYKIYLENEISPNLKLINGEYFFKDESCKCDIALVSILCPSDLDHPFLPYRLNDQVFYSNCFTCLKQKRTNPCRHRSANKRRFVSVYTMEELAYAVSELKYEVKYFYELYHYSSSGMVLKEFVDILASERLKNSNVLDGLHPYLQSTYCECINGKMNFDHDKLLLKPENCKNNQAQSKFIKLLTNSLLGRFALHSNFSKRTFLRSDHDLDLLLSNHSNTILEFFPVNAHVMEVEYITDTGTSASKEGNLIWTALINSRARIKMHKLIQTLSKDNCDLLYVDTDSVAFVSKTNYLLPFDLTPAFGDLKNVIEGAEITEFLSLGPRSYCVVYEQNGQKKYLTKIKGLNLAADVVKGQITPEVFESYLNDHFNEQVETKYIPQQRQTVSVQTKSFKQMVYLRQFSNELHLKRFIVPKDKKRITYSFGYSFKNQNLKRYL